MSQLPLKFKVDEDKTFINFYSGNNVELVTLLKKAVLSLDNSYFYLWGNFASGKTHLLQACCQLASSKGKSLFYLPFREKNYLSPDVLDDLENSDLICLDDIDAVLGDREWEEALFHFYNRVQMHQKTLVISGNQPAMQLECHLRDLHSRLCSGVIFRVHELNDQQKLLALQLCASYRGLQLTREVAQYLLRHCPRNMKDLSAILDQLDQASLTEKRRLTIPFVKEVLVKPSSPSPRH